MKNKVLFVSIICSIIFTNCGSNDERIDPVDPVMKIVLTKMTIISYDNPTNPQTSTATLAYNDKGEVSTSISNDGRFSKFEYTTDGKITKGTYYKSDNSIEYITNYTYAGTQLTNVKAVYGNTAYNRSYNFIYNSNNQLISESLCQSEPCTNTSKTTYTYNGNNIATEIYESGGTFSYNDKKEYTYDSKPNQFSTTNKQIRLMMGGAYALSENNYKTEKISNKSSNGTWVESQTITYDIQYNEYQFPTQVIGKDQNGNKYVQYNYEYKIL